MITVFWSTATLCQSGLEQYGERPPGEVRPWAGGGGGLVVPGGGGGGVLAELGRHGEEGRQGGGGGLAALHALAVVGLQGLGLGRRVVRGQAAALLHVRGLGGLPPRQALRRVGLPHRLRVGRVALQSGRLVVCSLLLQVAPAESVRTVLRLGALHHLRLAGPGAALRRGVHRLEGGGGVGAGAGVERGETLTSSRHVVTVLQCVHRRPHL